ncbi:hypothetical protein D9M71_213720 [compost metagenome]
MGKRQISTTLRGVTERGIQLGLAVSQQLQALRDRSRWLEDELQAGHLRNGGQHIVIEADPGLLFIAI